MDPNQNLLRENREIFSDHSRYHHLVGKLNHLIITRLNISFAVSIIGQFLEAPRVLTLGCCYSDSSVSEGSLQSGHADWAGSPLDRRSTIAPF